MFERMVVAIDGSPESSKTIPVAVDLAQKYRSSVVVVHVREYTRYEGADIDMGPPIPASELVDNVVARFADAGVDASGEIRRISSGKTAEQIVEVASTSQAGLIVMGTRGMTELKSLVLGGVANKVVHQAHCPVLLVR
jgi:nucleotide-binding universal stress UspA family protein